MTPHYKHDCKDCKPLGSHTYNATYIAIPSGLRTNVDLYYCTRDRDHVLLITRYGDHGQDYVGTAVAVVRRYVKQLTAGTYTPGLIEALRRYDEAHATTA